MQATEDSFSFVSNGVTYTRFREKTGGKNNSEVDGFYRDGDGRAFFIKKPQDKRELFTELFAGLLLDAFIKHNLVPEQYKDALIYAKYIQLPGGDYALIQPCRDFTILHEQIGSTKDGDRSVLWEALNGPAYYNRITEGQNYQGLSFVLMMSLLLGAYSVHSGNIVAMRKGEGTLYGRIDWGDAFRDFGKENKDILNPPEIQGVWGGLFNPKAYTKRYFEYYRQMAGLFPAIAEKCEAFKQEFAEHNNIFLDLIGFALAQMPEDLIDKKTQDELAEYLGIAEFKDVVFGAGLENEGIRAFAQKMTGIILKRVGQISALTDAPDAAAENLYASVAFGDKPSSVSSQPEVLHKKKEIEISLNNPLNFVESLLVIHTLLGSQEEDVCLSRKSHMLLLEQHQAFCDELKNQFRFLGIDSLTDEQEKALTPDVKRLVIEARNLQTAMDEIIRLLNPVLDAPASSISIKASDNITGFRATYHALQIRLCALKNHRQQAEQRAIKAQIESLKRQNSELRTQISQSKTEVSGLNAEIARLKKEAATSSAGIQSLDQQMTANQDELANKIKRLGELESQIEQLEAKLKRTSTPVTFQNPSKVVNEPAIQAVNGFFSNLIQNVLMPATLAS